MDKFKQKSPKSASPVQTKSLLKIFSIKKVLYGFTARFICFFVLSKDKKLLERLNKFGTGMAAAFLKASDTDKKCVKLV